MQYKNGMAQHQVHTLDLKQRFHNRMSKILTKNRFVSQMSKYKLIRMGATVQINYILVVEKTEVSMAEDNAMFIAGLGDFLIVVGASRTADVRHSTLQSEKSSIRMCLE